MTLDNLNLTVKDFKVEILATLEPNYSSNFLARCERTIIAKVNGCKLEFRSGVNYELIQDIEAYTGLDARKELNKIVEYEAINVYINNIKWVRKQKLLKIEQDGKCWRLFSL